jgi:transposase
VLEAPQGLAESWSVASVVPCAAGRTEQSWTDRLWSRASLDSASVPAKRGGAGTGPNPLDRGRPGSKRHVVTDARGVPIAIALTSAHVHDSKMFEELIDSIALVRGKRGRPHRRPEKLHADKGYDYPRCRRFLRKRGIQARIARRGVESGERLGRHQWVVERTLASLSRCRRLCCTLRAARGHPRGFLGSVLRTYLPQLSPTGVLKRALRKR